MQLMPQPDSACAVNRLVSPYIALHGTSCWASAYDLRHLGEQRRLGNPRQELKQLITRNTLNPPEGMRKIVWLSCDVETNAWCSLSWFSRSACKQALTCMRPCAIVRLPSRQYNFVSKWWTMACRVPSNDCSIPIMRNCNFRK